MIACLLLLVAWITLEKLYVAMLPFKSFIEALHIWCLGNATMNRKYHNLKHAGRLQYTVMQAKWMYLTRKLIWTYFLKAFQYENQVFTPSNRCITVNNIYVMNDKNIFPTFVYTIFLLEISIGYGVLPEAIFGSMDTKTVGGLGKLLLMSVIILI